jgi:hypothetical protein
VSSIPLGDTRPLLPRRPRRGSVLSGRPRAADDGGPHRKIAPRTPQGRDGPRPARSPPTPEGRSRQELGIMCAGRSRGAFSAMRPLPNPKPACGEGEGVQEGVGGRSHSLQWPVPLSHGHLNLFMRSPLAPRLGRRERRRQHRRGPLAFLAGSARWRNSPGPAW